MRTFLSILVAVVIASPCAWAQMQWTNWDKQISISITSGQHQALSTVPANGPKNSRVTESLDGLYTYPFPENDDDHEVIRGYLWVDNSNPCPFVEVTEDMVRGSHGNADSQECSNIDLRAANNFIEVTHEEYLGSGNFFFHTANFRVHAWDPGAPDPNGPGGE